ncbi:histone acetyltransferases subunit 3-domain-containing protein [Annulohypoxylon truncatum]|uniref:histone acetyltransferases subunit 3-domain-containing protein n=1 Tax=Annulohypoxylon truncatum TaxID=327061 RepID=UPI002008BD57|nr:histone acetyltransferases subunit 3-domain-containing protein [Annulohypoxylon truncatum]KAI1209248.1 histone acetyltransferases subunit 3-domain-containing protein [Annulohypoxylon truncatum]
MPPAPSQKGTGKKNANAMGKRSRNTTPMSIGPSSANIPPVDIIETEYLDLKLESVRSINYDDLVDSSASNALIPDSRSLDGLITRLGKLNEIIERRGASCDRGMRLVATHRKAHFDEMAPVSRRDDTRKDGEEETERRANKKKRKANDSLAPGDAHTERSSPLRDHSKTRKPSRDNDSASSSLSPVAPATPGAMEVDEKAKLDNKAEEDSESEDEGAPPRREAPQIQTFGEDPSTYPDPTVYEILPTKPGMTVDELKKLYSVAVFPKTDLADMIAGDPPDKDFSSAKPSNQISFSTFSTYIEPYFRQFSEEDLAFLRERGDRLTPFVMPKRGKKHYTEVWAEEDGAMAIDSTLPGRDKLAPNQARGTIDNMDDDVAETDKLSVGPVLSRLLQAMRPEARAQPSEDKPMTNGINGDAEVKEEVNGDSNTGAAGEEKSAPPATFMTESSTEAWKKATHPKLDYSQVDERIKLELRNIGFLPLEGFDGDYDGHYDDEVAARLRLLQDRLREQMLINGARKARLTDLVKERMAHQEYTTILEDLDTQVQGAYLKRTRTMGKSKKSKRPGGAGGGSHPTGGAGSGMARPGIGDVTKTLMERRKRWIENIAPVFNDPNLGKVPRATNPGSTIFKPEMMADLMKKERQAWDEEVEEE